MWRKPKPSYWRNWKDSMQRPSSAQRSLPLRLGREPVVTPKLEAFPYQLDAVEAIRDLEYAAVFHEQGLGKTKIAIDVLLYWLRTKVIDTVMLVTKKGLIANWEREFAVHAYVRPRLLTLNAKANYYVFNSPVRVILTHFEAIQKEEKRIEIFCRTRKLGIIIDESARLKNPDTGLTQSFIRLSAGFIRRIIMTGTPVANRPEDVWSQICFLDHGVSLGENFKEFRARVQLQKGLEGNAEGQQRFQYELEDVQQRIAPFSVRETKNSGVITLPNKLIHAVPTEWERIQFDMYRQVRNDLRAVLIRDGQPVEENEEPVLRRLVRLIQIASNPRMLDTTYAGEPGKMAALQDILYTAHDQNEKAIVWTSFTDNVDWLTRELRNFGARRVHGKLGIEARERSLSAFLTDSRVEVLVATPASAKEGLTLTVANHVIFYDRTFSLDDYLQAQDRIHRISQEKICHVHNLIMTDSIDEWVAVLLEAKHTAAQLAQGDLSPLDFQAKMRYDFGQVLAGILGTG